MIIEFRIGIQQDGTAKVTQATKTATGDNSAAKADDKGVPKKGGSGDDPGPGGGGPGSGGCVVIGPIVLCCCGADSTIGGSGDPPGTGGHDPKTQDAG